MRSRRWLSCLLVAACHAAPPAVPVPAAATASDPTIVAMLARVDGLLAARPSDGVLLYHRASLMLLVGAQPAEALAFLERLDASGWDNPLADIDYGPLLNDARYRELAARIADRAPKVERSAVAFSVPGSDLVPEGIAVDPKTGTFYVGSVRKRTIVAIDPRGVVRRFIPEGHGGVLGVLGVKIDEVRGVLWAASHGSGVVEGYRRGAAEPDGAYAFSLADGSVRRRVRFVDGAPHLANDLAIARDGTAYLTDSAGGAVYRIPPDRDELEPVTPPGTFGYPNGLALTDDNRLYVADLIGISVVALDTRAVTRLTAPPHVALGGFDGLVLRGDRLLGVQGAIGQPRIVAISIDGDRATGLTVLENSAAALEIATTTCVWRDALYTVANAQLFSFGPDGALPGRTPSDPRILRTPL